MPVLHSLAVFDSIHGFARQYLRSDDSRDADGMPTIVTTTAAEDFLALVPHLVGFAPRNSLVLVGFRGTRTCGAMRFDLPRTQNEVTARRIATSAVGMLSRLPGVDAVVPVVYTDEEFGDVIPREAFMREILRRAEFSGFLARDALCVAVDGWASYLDDDYPPGGYGLERITGSSAVSAAGLPAVDGLLAGAALPASGVFAAERIALVLRDLRREVILSEAECLLDRWLFLDDLPRHMEGALSVEPREQTEEQIALLVFLLQRPSVRDGVMLLWAFDLETGYRVFELNSRFHQGERITADPDGELMLGHGPRPDPHRIEAAIALLKHVTALAPRSSRPPLLCMLSWLNWALGRGSVAGVFLDLAVAIEPGYGLAEVLATMLHNGILPEWAFEDAEEAPPAVSESAGSVSGQ